MFSLFKTCSICEYETRDRNVFFSEFAETFVDFFFKLLMSFHIILLLVGSHKFKSQTYT